MYGISRTIVKIKGKYHIKRKFHNLPKNKKFNRKSHIGLIGCGNFSFSNIAYFLSKNKKNCIRTVMDIDINKAASLYKEYNCSQYTNQIEDLINDKNISLVFVASNHATHAEYAVKCIKAGKDVHIEKPHVVNNEQLRKLEQVHYQYPSRKIFLGFNRPKSKLFNTLKKHLKRESGPMMISWFIAGHNIDSDHWYFNPKEGGRVLGNLSHWTDLTLNLIGLDQAFPCKVSALSLIHI